MWTPKQWSVAFPVLSAVLLLLDVVWVRAAQAGLPLLVALAAGVIGGVFAAIGWVLRPLLLGVSLVCATATLVVIGAAEATADVGTLTGVVAAIVAFGWVVVYEQMHVRSLVQTGSREAEHFGDPSASRRAVMIHHPSPHGFLQKQLRTLGEALAQQGLRVDMIDVRDAGDLRAPQYDLVVLAAPVFSFRPADPILAQIPQLDLKDRPTILVLSGFGMTEPAMRRLHALALGRGARIIWTERPNAERHGTNDEIEIMRRAAVAAGHAVPH